MVRRGVKCGIPQKRSGFSAFCGLFAYAADLRHVHGVKVGIRGLLNWTAEYLSMGNVRRLSQ
jgi:hypothetical protein